MPQLRAYFLGPFRVTRDDQSAIALRSDKMRALLAYLLIESGRPHRREALAALLWPDQPDIVALQNLRQALYIVRQSVGEILLVTRQTAEFNLACKPVPGANKPVPGLSPIQALSPSDVNIPKLPTSSVPPVENGDVWCDVWLFSELLAACKAHRQRQVGHPDRCAACIHRLQQATELYRGDFLQGFVVNDSREFEEWMLLERETLHRQMMDALEQLAGYYEEVGEHEQSLNYALWQLKVEPWREESHRQAMRLLSRTGQRSAALAQYETARQVLFEELGTEPARETTALYERIRDAETEQPGPEGTPRPLPVLGKRLLPIASTPLIGREAEVTGVVEDLLRDEVRVLTVTGPGGVGKTRIAMQAAADLQEHFADGAYFVNLAPITDPGLVAAEIASALGVKEMPDKTVMEVMVSYLQGKQALLLLDNFEQVAEVAPLIAQLIQSAPGVKALVTSRMSLGLRGTQEYPIPPMSLPDRVRLPALERVAGYEGIRLFMARAAAIKPGFEITDGNAAAIVEICHRLDGLPLAIELAAARIKVLSPQAMLSRLQNRLQLIASKDRDAPTRQQTLRNTIEWSYDLLDAAERKLFRRMSVFSGGSTLEAIEAVCNPDGELKIDALDGVQSLVDKNLLRQEEGAGGEPRFWMLETIHEYAREKLGESRAPFRDGEAEPLQKEHALYFMRLAEEAALRLTTEKQQEWLQRLEEEHDNMRATMGWALARGEAETALRVGWSLSHFWQFLGYLSEGRKWLESALQLPGAQEHAQASALALVGAGYLAWRQHDFAAAVAHSRQSAAIWSQLQARGESGPEVVRGLAGARAIEGISAMFLGDQAGRARSEEALMLLRQTGDKGGLAGALAVLGAAQVAIAQADYAAARAMLDEGVELFRQWGDKWGLAQALNSRGDIARIEGDYARAEGLYEESLMIHRGMDSRADIPASLHNLGYATLGLGNARRAVAFFVEALNMQLELEDQAGVVECLAGLAGVAGAEQQPERAARLFGAAEALREAMNAPLWPAERADYERNKATARAQLSEEEFERAWAEGRAMSTVEAVDYALEET